ncbi:MAG TPA: hypothetical protein VH352_11220, partial [Pseudonocardiaceae bacterium]|nr:hypothetical protein [Pseudonocardiaceae bacterium]
MPSPLRSRRGIAALASVLLAGGVIAALTTTADPANAANTNLITNPGFETGDLTGWATVTGTASIVSSGAHSGTYAAQLGATTATNGDSSISQSFTVAQP